MTIWFALVVFLEFCVHKIFTRVKGFPWKFQLVDSFVVFFKEIFTCRKLLPIHSLTAG